MNHKFKADYNKCTKCGLCVENCSPGALDFDEYHSPKMANPKNCMECQHCFAVCPVGAISILDKNPDESNEIKNINPDDILNLIQSRRSTRKYKRENVSKETLEKLKQMLNYSPTGKNSHALHFSFIEDVEVMEDFKKKVYDSILKFLNKKPVQYFSEKFKKFSRFKKAILSNQDIIFRNAPHLVVVSAPVDSSCPHQDGIIALSYFELYANSLGLGTCWCGYGYALLKMFGEFCEYLQVPKGYMPVYVMLFGYKDIEFKRTTQPKPYTFTTIEKQDLEVDFLTKIKRFLWNSIR